MNETSTQKFDFSAKLLKFNALYMLPTSTVPCIPWVGDANASARTKTIERLKAFKRTLQDELNEVDEIVRRVEAGDPPVEILTELADWLGDIQVYCASEMLKYGLDRDVILGIIMGSNMSKLGADGKPIINDDGKVMKGPNYWKPEPMIKLFIEASLREHARRENAAK